MKKQGKQKKEGKRIEREESSEEKRDTVKKARK